MEILKTLYASTEEVKAIKTNVGKVFLPGIGNSCHRHGETGGVKLSAAALFVDFLQEGKHFSVYKSNVKELTYVEIENVSFAIKKGTAVTIYCGDQTRDELKMLFALVAFFASTDDEGKKIMAEIILQKNAIEISSVLKLCDSFYYGLAKLYPVINEERLNLQEIQRAFANEEMEQIAVFDKVSEKSTLEKTTKKLAKAKGNFFTDCKAGCFAIPYSWNSKVKKLIPPITELSFYEPTQEFELLVKKIYNKLTKIIALIDGGMSPENALRTEGASNILIVGKPGTGKTVLARALAAALQMPCCTTEMSKNSEEDTWQGKTCFVDGKPSFIETESLLLHQFGGIDVTEEINLADPAVTMGGLGQKLEYPYIVKKNGYESIVRNPMNIVIATMNVGTEGSKPLNQALQNRFNVVLVMDDPQKKDFIKILQKKTGASKEMCDWLYDIYTGAKNYLSQPSINEIELCDIISLRSCLGLYENLKDGCSMKLAVWNSIGGAISAADIELGRKIKKEWIDVLPENTPEIQ